MEGILAKITIVWIVACILLYGILVAPVIGFFLRSK